MEVVIKPRNKYTSNALRRAAPQVDLSKKLKSLTMSMINMGSGVRLFNANPDGVS